MAIPTSAWASAGASLTPSPTMATRWPCSCRSRDRAVLVLGQYFGEDLVDVQLGRDRFGDRSGIAGDHHHLRADRVQRVDRLARLRTHFVVSADRPDHRIVDEHVQDGRASAPTNRTCSASRLGDSTSRSSAGPPTATVRPSTSLDPDSGRPGSLWRPARRATGRRRRPDGPGHRVLAVGLDCGGEREHRRSASPSARSRRSRVLAPGQRAGLVEQHRVDGAHRAPARRRSLTRMPPRAARPVEIATTSGMARPSACGQAMTRTVTVRSTAASTSTEQRPHHEGDHGRAERRRRTASRRTGRRALGARARSSGPARRGAGCRRARCRRRRASTRTRIGGVGRHGAGDDAVAGGRGRPAGDSPVIIDSSSSAVPSTISPSAGTRPPGRTSTTSPTRELGERRPSTCDRRRSARPRRAAARPARPGRPWAWPIARISSQWPSSMIVTSGASSHQKSMSIQPSWSRQRRPERHGDRHAR